MYKRKDLLYRINDVRYGEYRQLLILKGLKEQVLGSVHDRRERLACSSRHRTYIESVETEVFLGVNVQRC